MVQVGNRLQVMVESVAVVVVAWEVLLLRELEVDLL